MTTYNSLNIAVVISKSNVKDKLEKGTYHIIASTIKADRRYDGSVVSLVPWDGENEVDWSKYSHIILASGITYAPCSEQFISWLDGLNEPTQQRIFNPPHIIKWNLDKKYLLEMKNKGILIPASVFIDGGKTPALSTVLDDLSKQMEGNTTDVVIVKSKVDAGGHSTQRLSLNNLDAATKIFQNLLRQHAQSGLIVQEYLNAINSEGEWSIVFFDKKISHAVLKQPSNDGFKVQNRFGGKNITMELHDVPQEIVKFSEDVINSISAKKILYARVDIVRNKNNLPSLMELEAFEPDLYITHSSIAQNFISTICSY